ncbi:MAG: hypothetical protein E6R06_00305 [Mycobacterium sp.]|nr:MAG: hypothetical protein E6R06_00305 [Mycobacterium sp.]
MKRQMPAGTIFIYCDDALHPKRVPVTNYCPIGEPPAWVELRASNARPRAESSQYLIGDEVPTPGFSVRGVSMRDLRASRNRSRLECRKCHRPVPATERKLHAALDAFAANGVSEVSLAVLAASLKRIV